VEELRKDFNNENGRVEFLSVSPCVRIVVALAFLRRKGAKSAFSNLQAVYRIGLVVP